MGMGEYKWTRKTWKCVEIEWEPRVLRELDQNIANQQQKLNAGKNKSGVWRRKCSMKGKIYRKDGGEGIENKGNRNSTNGKKGFCLIDKKGLEEETAYSGKKVKVGLGKKSICEKLMNVANQK